MKQTRLPKLDARRSVAEWNSFGERCARSHQSLSRKRRDPGAIPASTGPLQSAPTDDPRAAARRAAALKAAETRRRNAAQPQPKR